MVRKRHRGQLAPKGRGTVYNPPNRFGSSSYFPDQEENQQLLRGRTPTSYIADHSCSIITRNQSPDVGFDKSLNPYRGCEHGCVYCYARPTHEFLGYSAGLDFETKIVVKKEAPMLLEEALMRESWQPEVLAMSGVTDPYQPIERQLQITRGCLQVLARFRNPVSVITKNQLVTRDIDILTRLAEFGCVSVTLSITTLDAELARVMEPRTATPSARLGTIRKLAAAGIPVGVNVAPVIPGLNDEEIPSIIEAAGQAGAQRAGYIVLRLPMAVAPLFENWLKRNFPDRCKRVLDRIRSLRGGRLNTSVFGERMRGGGIWATQIKQLFDLGNRRAGFTKSTAALKTEHFTKPGLEQTFLFP